MLIKLLLVFFGAGAGGACRWGVQLACEQRFGKGFPAGTLIVNVLGCLAVGVLAGALAGPEPSREHWRLGLIVGFLGGFTTFSAFGRETVLLGSEGNHTAAVANIALSVGLGLLAVWIGARLGTRLMAA